jgi:hypothetical protein
MKLNLLSCDAQRPDKRAIAKCIAEISSNVDDSLSNELTAILLEGVESSNSLIKSDLQLHQYYFNLYKTGLLGEASFSKEAICKFNK